MFTYPEKDTISTSIGEVTGGNGDGYGYAIRWKKDELLYFLFKLYSARNVVMMSVLHKHKKIVSDNEKKLIPILLTLSLLSERRPTFLLSLRAMELR